MKANELMIGDLVLFDHNPVRVAILVAAQDSLGLAAGDNVFGRPYSMIEPIPLTAEILEKNWWKKEDVFGSLIKYRFTGPIDIETGGETFRLSNDYFFCGGIHYVHELQHALRMCGVEKDITI